VRPQHERELGVLRRRRRGDGRAETAGVGGLGVSPRQPKIPRVAVDDLVQRARELNDKIRPPRGKQQDPDAYVRVVKRQVPPGPPVRDRGDSLGDLFTGDDDE
jgi:hypothetical protein